MIGVDTNIVVRLFVADEDPDQHRKSVAFFAERTADDPASIGPVVLVELVWLLTRRYGYSVDDVMSVLRRFLDSANVHVQNRQVVVRAMLAAEETGIGIADCLIAEFNAAAGCRTTMTFDKGAAKRIPGMELIK